jgi:hypothetical protein
VATFVLVQGGGHGGWCYKFVSERICEIAALMNGEKAA